MKAAPDPLERSKKAKSPKQSLMRAGVGIALCVVLAGGVLYALPSLLVLESRLSQDKRVLDQFPVTVDPKNKVITENAQVNALFEQSSPFAAAAGNASQIARELFNWFALSIVSAPWYESIAAADQRFVAIKPGMRKEQVSNAFASALLWSDAEKARFTTPVADAPLPLAEGSFSPGIYAVVADATPVEAQALVNKRFEEDVLSRYGTTTAAIVPLEQALTIASLIEREAGGPDDMRIISGIIWNRLFINMRLQVDATLQYAKANTPIAKSWWPSVVPADRFRKSPFNTYLNKGLPPAPIANPSVASILAALNPVETSCLFYFHDAARQFHCSDTYAGHVALLKKYYGRGK
jgi:UPF0755 protein